MTLSRPLRHGDQICLPEIMFPNIEEGPVVVTLSFWWGGAMCSVHRDIPFTSLARGVELSPNYRPNRYS